MQGNLNYVNQKHVSFSQLRKIRLLYECVPILAIMFTIVSCATRPIAISTTRTYEGAFPLSSEVLILSPLLKFERLHDETILDPSEFGGPAIISNLNARARNALVKGKFRIAQTESLKATEFVDLLSRLQSLSSSLSTGQVKDEANGILKRLSAQNQHLLILSHFLYSKVGPGGYWNPNTGAIGSSMSTCRIRVSLIQCSTAQVLWKNEVILRQLPQVGSSTFEEALDLLYTNFPEAKED